MMSVVEKKNRASIPPLWTDKQSPTDGLRRPTDENTVMTFSVPTQCSSFLASMGRYPWDLIRGTLSVGPYPWDLIRGTFLFEKHMKLS